VYVEVGADLLSEASEDEEDILDKAFDVRMNSRLGCQARLLKDGLVAVRISRESLEAYANEHPDG
jgi:2Fe-2S ferredoxin